MVFYRPLIPYFHIKGKVIKIQDWTIQPNPNNTNAYRRGNALDDWEEKKIQLSVFNFMEKL